MLYKLEKLRQLSFLSSIAPQYKNHAKRLKQAKNRQIFDFTISSQKHKLN